MPSVAIIIPTRGRPETLKVCLRQIVPYVREHPECMIVVTDDGEASTTQAEIGAEFEGIKVVQGPRRGPAANRNCGVANSNGDLLIFLDDDCRPAPDLIAVYQRAAAQDPECGVFEGRISAEGKAESFGDVAPSNEEGGYLWSCNFAIRRELFISIGGFDERYPFATMEDADLHFRLAGRSPIQFLAEAKASHALERRVAWKVVKHHSLSLLLYLHLHGLKATKHGVGYFVRLVGHLTVSGFSRVLRRQASKDPHYLLMMIWANSQMLFIVVFWRFHPLLARWFFPADCSGCQSIHECLAHG